MLQGAGHVRYEGLSEECDDRDGAEPESDSKCGASHGNHRPTLELSTRTANNVTPHRPNIRRLIKDPKMINWSALNMLITRTISKKMFISVLFHIYYTIMYIPKVNQTAFAGLCIMIDVSASASLGMAWIPTSDTHNTCLER
jgi:hypothetical protein